MGLFANTSTPLDSHIDRATSDKNTSDDWSVILDVCDKVKEYNDGPKDCIKLLSKKLTNDNPRVVLQAITLLDACVSNCGRNFLLEVASREFVQDLRKLITSLRTHSKVSEKLRKCLKSWAEGEFKSDRQLSLIPDLYSKLQQEDYDFTNFSDSPKKKKVEYSNDPNVVNNKQEEDDIAQAIQLSLQSASSSSPKNQSSFNSASSRSLYPSDLTGDLASSLDSGLVLSDSKGPASSSSTNVQDATKKARALYDFEAVEDNELTFLAGELIVVIDSSDPNWWKGSNHRGEGLFPANFVTLDIHGEQEQQPHRNEKRVSFSEMVKVTEVEGGGLPDPSVEEGGQVAVEVTGEVDEEKINFLLHLLHEADPTGERLDDPRLPVIEEQVAAMAPTIDAELEQIDRRHNELSKLNVDLMQGINLYHQLMREMPINSLAGYYPPPYGGQPPPLDPVTGLPLQQMVPGYQPYPPMQMMGGAQAPPPGTGITPYPSMGMAPPGMVPSSVSMPPVSMPATSMPAASMAMNGSLQTSQTTTALYQPPPTTSPVTVGASTAVPSQDSVNDSSNFNVGVSSSSMLPTYGGQQQQYPDGGGQNYSLPPPHYQQVMSPIHQQQPPPVYASIPLQHQLPPTAAQPTAFQ